LIMRYFVAVLIVVGLACHVDARSPRNGPSKMPRDSDDSYGQLALKYVPSAFVVFELGLKELSNETVPGHTKLTRGPIADARTVLDIFAYAYPLSTNHDNTTDVYLLLVADLTDGHFTLGEYSDLGSVNYTAKEKAKLLAKCLAWKATYEKHSAKYDYPSFVNAPSNTTLYHRKKHVLSGHFWGNVKHTPSPTLTGIQNIALLQDGQLQQLIDQYSTFHHYTNVWNKAVHKQFHNYRKDMRYQSQVGAAFTVIYKNEATFNATDVIVHEAEHHIGSVNDHIEEYLYYAKKGNKSKMKKLVAKITALWEKEQARLKKSKFESVLENALADLIDH